MRSLSTDNAEPYFASRIYPILKSFADAVCGTLARLIAYVGTLALLGIGGIHLWDQLPVLLAAEPATEAALRSLPSASAIYSQNQRLTRYSGAPKATIAALPSQPSASVDWVTSAEKPRLRGAF
jgi:hypothetical protein